MTNSLNQNISTETIRKNKQIYYCKENPYSILTHLHICFRNNKNYQHICRRCLNTYENQSKLEEKKSRCIEQDVCNVLYTHLKKTLNFNDWCMITETPMWINGDFECMNICCKSNNGNFFDKLFVSNPFAIGYNIVQNEYYDNLNLKKHGCKPGGLRSICDYNKKIGQNYVELLITEMLEEATYSNICFKIDIELNLFYNR